LSPRPPRRWKFLRWCRGGREIVWSLLHVVADLLLSMCVAGLVSEYSDRFESSTMNTSALGRLSLGTGARRLPGCH
jgi:hypothetical protein